VTGNGRVIEFTPDQPLASSAYVQVFVSTEAQDQWGNALNSYQSSFTTAADPHKQTPSVVSVSPAYLATGQPQNTVIDVAYSEDLDPVTVTTNAVLLRDTQSRTPVAVTVSVQGTRVVRIQPQTPLAASTEYSVRVSGIRDLDGATASEYWSYFTTGSGTDVVAPQVVAVTPADGATLVGVNANLRVRFNEAVNPVTANPGTIQIKDGASLAVVPYSISFGNNNRDVLVVPYGPLPAATQLTVAIEGVEDRAGNVVT
jgi:hypothetical protein